MKKPSKRRTFRFFDYKWSRVPSWGMATQDLYRRWYLQRYGYRTVAEFRRFLRDKDRILEAGCGPARDSKFFAELNPCARILAVDQSPRAVRIARKTLSRTSHCEVRRDDITRARFGDEFDFISCDQVLHHTPDPGKTMSHLFGHLRKGGVLNFSVCKKKNRHRELADDLIMRKAQNMGPDKLWEFARAVTEFGKVLHGLGIDGVTFDGKKYGNLQRFVHNHLFRCWFNPDLDLELSVSSNYDWFSGNPRFSASEVKTMMNRNLRNYRVLNFCEDDATISVSLMKSR